MGEEHMWGKRMWLPIQSIKNSMKALSVWNANEIVKAERSTFYDLFGPLCSCFPFKEVFTSLLPIMKKDTK